MPYRLRLFRDDHLLIATDLETTEEAGQRVAEFGAGVRREVVYRDEDGRERPVTSDEENEVFFALSERLSEISEAQVEPCPRCGLRKAEHAEPLNPVRVMRDGPIYFSCWTPEERESAGL